MNELTTLTQEQARYAARGVTVVDKLARIFAHEWRTIDPSDFVSIGHEAVVRAATRFDPTRGVTFEQFARQPVWGAMLDLAHREKFTVQQAVRGIARVMAESAESERSTDDWLAESTAPARDEVVRELRARAADMVAAAFAGREAPLSSEDVYIEEEERRATMTRLRIAVRALSDKERSFIQWYYEEEETLEAIAQRMGCVKRTVQRLHEGIKASLAHALSDLPS